MVDIEKLYPGFSTFHGPFLRKKDNRQHVCLYDSGTKKKKTISYSKLLLEIKIGRLLVEDETCDHIDGDATNDRLDNLQVLTRVENSMKSAPKNIELITLICEGCKKEYTRNKIAYLRERRCRPARRNCCSKRCVSKVSHL